MPAQPATACKYRHQQRGPGQPQPAATAPLPPPPPPALSCPRVAPCSLATFLPPVWKAAAYGDFEKLQELADTDPDALHRTDEQGFFALQWAALNNRVAVVTYLLDRGCDVNAADGTGQSALHWAAVRGSTAALETMLRAGADLGARDSRWVLGGCGSWGKLHALSLQPPLLWRWHTCRAA